MQFLCIIIVLSHSQNSLKDVVDPTDGLAGHDGHAEVSLWSAAVVVAPVVCLSRGLTNQDLRYGQRKERG